MTALRSIALFAALAATMGAARAEPELNGTWQATFTTASSENRGAQVVIDGLGGTWTTCARSAQRHRHSCVGRPQPISLSDSGASTVTLRIEGSKPRAANTGRQARLTLVDMLTLEGEFDDGRVLRLVRQPAPGP
ncbi:MAG: hypothetical protein V4569_05350 [Pseudomonadota bacterium]